MKCIESMIEELEQTYQAKTGIDIKINIERHFEISIQDIGGVMITTKNRRIFLENTLVMRLINIALQAIPLMCSGLFGPNPTRTHSRVIF